MEANGMKTYSEYQGDTDVASKLVHKCHLSSF